MIVVTGAAGLIGSAVVREFNRRGVHNLILVDHLGESEKWMNLRSLHFQDYYEKGVFLSLLKNNEISGIQHIVHLGADSSTTTRNASYLIENNYRYSIELAEYALPRGIRMVYASSAATYGDGNDGFDDSLDGLHLLRPLNAYGYSKHLFDQWLQSRGFPEQFVGLKYFNVYGPNEYHKGEMRSLVLKAFYQIQAEGRIRLFKSYHPDYKDGEQMRDFLYVEDAARMTVYFCMDGTGASGLFNCGSGVARTWNELAAAIFKAMDKAPDIEYIDMPESLKAKYQYYTCAPIDRLRSSGYSETISSLEDAVADYVTRYLLPGELRA